MNVGLFLHDGYSAPVPPQPELIDINTVVPNINNSSPKRMVTVTYTPFGTVTPVTRGFFVASATPYGAEFWITDGTTEGTKVIDGLRPGSGSSDPQNVTVIGSRIYFTADNGDSAAGRELYEFDPALRDWRFGTGANDAFKRRANIASGSASSNPALFTVLNGQLYFRAQTSTTAGAENFEIYRWDPAVPATAPVVITNFTAATTVIANLTAVGTDRLFFTANDTTATTVIGNELYCYATSGTVTALDVLAGPDSSNPASLVSLDADGTGPGAARLFFQASQAAATPLNQELFVSDGTVAGTVLFKDIQSGTGSGLPQNLYVHTRTTAGNPQVLYFSAASSATNQELWSTNAAGTDVALLKEIRSGSNASTPAAFASLGDLVLFSANDGTTGVEPWKTDGTALGTVLLANINTTGSNSSPTRFTTVGNTSYFRAAGPGVGTELYKTDGTTVTLVKDILTGGTGSDSGTTAADQPQMMALGSSQLLLAATNGTVSGTGAGIELWSSDGTESGTVLLKDANGPGDSEPRRFVRLGDIMYFTATHPANGHELYSSSGTAASTQDLSDASLRLGATGSDPQWLKVWNNKLYFSADTGTTGGTAPGNNTGRELWVYDPAVSDDGGTAHNERFSLVADINNGTGNSSPTQLTEFNGKLYFAASTATLGYELYVYDGVAAPVRATTSELRVGASDPAISNLFVFGDYLYFTATDGTNGTELYRLEKSAADFEKMDLSNTGGGAPLTASSAPSRFCVVPDMASGPFVGQDVLFFVASDGVVGEELWIINPNTNLPVMVANINTTTEVAVSTQRSSSPRDMIAFKGLLFFDANISDTTTENRELYTSDGSGAGTGLFLGAPINPAAASSMASDTNMVISADGNWLYMRATKGDTAATELYRTDGSTPVALVADINISSSTSSTPVSLYTVPDSTYIMFNADSGSGATTGVVNTLGGQNLGREWWVTDGTPAGTQVIADINPNVVPHDPNVTLRYNSDPNNTLDVNNSRLNLAGLSNNGGSTPSEAATTFFEGAGGKLFFRALNNDTGRELYVMSAAPDPVATTTGVNNQITTATFEGSVDRQGSKATYYFEWGTDTNYGNVTPETDVAGGAIPSSSSDSPAVVVTSALPPASLLPDTLYHFRLVAKNRYGISYGSDFSFLTAPSEIAVQDPDANDLLDNAPGPVGFGTLLVGDSVTRTFTISNTGTGPLSNVNVTVGAGDFTLDTSATLSTVPAGSSTTFTVTFAPTANGVRSAVISIASNDTDENPFEINVSGSGISTLVADYNAATDVPLTVDGLNAGPLSLDLALNFAPTPGTNLTVVKNTGPSLIQGTFNQADLTELENGETVTLTYGGQSYDFVAWYYGGIGGNDLVLLWKVTGLAAWGSNTDGRLGMGTEQIQVAPQTVDTAGLLAGKTVVQVATGSSHTLALTTEGRVYAWGLNSSGQLGDGTTTSRPRPVAVSIAGVLAGKTVKAIAAGATHSYALTTEGRIYAWGRFNEGQLGQATLPTGNATTPVEVDTTTSSLAGETVVALAAGGNYGLVLTADGEIHGWGQNSSGQLGDGGTTARNAPVATDMSALSALNGKRVVAIAAGNTHSLAATTEGLVYAWGRNSEGQIGNGLVSQVNRAVPADTGAGSSLNGKFVIDVQAGTNHSSATANDGTVHAWGQNTNGQVGDGTLVNVLLPVAADSSAASSLNGLSLSSVHALGSYTLALDSTGRVHGWGLNTSGQLGISSLANSSLPMAVTTAAPSALAGRQVTGLATSGGAPVHSVAIYGGTSAEIEVQDSAGNVLTDGSSTVNYGPVLVGASLRKTFTIRNTGVGALTNLSLNLGGADAGLFAVAGPALPSALSAGQSVTFDVVFTPAAAVAASADLQVLSDDTDEGIFEIGLSSTGSTSLAADFVTAGVPAATVESLTATGIPLTLTLSHVPAPGENLVVVDNQGQGFINGQFTQADTTTLTNGEVVQLTYGGSTYDFVAWYYGGDGNDLALVWKDNRLAAWGGNSEGRLGIGATGNRLLPVGVTSTGVLSGKTIVSVKNGGAFTLALASDGRVYSWGRNNEGQLGIGSTTSQTNPVAVDVGASSALNGKFVVAIAAGSNHALALTTEGKVYAWGSATSGGLGDNQNTTNRTRAVAVLDTGVLSGKTITAISAGTNFSVVLDSTGRLYAWGLGTSGQLGDNTILSKNAAVAVDVTTGVGTMTNPLSGREVVSFGAATSHVMALTRDGVLAAWGSNSSAQVGDGTTSNRSVPVAVDVGTASALNGRRVAQFNVGSGLNIVLDTQGTVLAWGAAGNGRLGNNTTTPNRSRAILVETAASSLNGKTATRIAANTSHAFALASDNTLHGWGANSAGQVGINSTVDQLVPAQVDVSASSVLKDKHIILLGHGPVAAHSTALYAVSPEISVEQPLATALEDGVSTVDFGSVLLTQSGTPKTFTIRNDGLATLTGLAISKSGANSADFTLGSLGATSLAPGATTTFTVTFSPGSSSLGDRAAVVSIASNDFSESSFDIAVTGKGITPDIAVSESAVNLNTPALVDFGTVLTTSYLTKTFTISNAGDGDLTGVAVSVSGSPNYTLDTTGTLAVLAPGGSTTFAVTFQPGSTGAAILGSLSIASSDLNENPFTVNLTGQGEAPPLGPVESSQGSVVTDSGAPDAGGTGSVGQFDVLRRGGFISENSHIVFPGTLEIGTGSPPVTAGDSAGLWKDDGFGLYLLARTGSAAPGTTGVFDTLPEVPAVADSDEVTFLATLRIGTGGVTSSNDSGVWSEIGGGGLQLLLREGDSLGGGALVDKFASGAYATAQIGATQGEAAFSITQRGSTTASAIVRTSVNGGSTTVAIVAQQAQAAPGLAGLVFAPLNGSYSDPARMDAQGNLAFTALLTPGSRESLWYQPRGGALAKVFSGTEAAPGTTATFSKIQPPAMGSNGVISFRATLNAVGDNATNQRNDGIWRGTGSNPASYTCILRRGDSGIPGLPAGSKVGNPWGGWLTNNNRGAWRAWIDMNGDGSVASRTTNDVHALFADTSGTMVMVIKEGDAAPGVAGATVAGFDHPLAGGQDQMAFIGNMTVGTGGVTAANDQAVWRQAPNGGALSLVLREGQTIATSVGAKTVQIIDVPGSGTTLSQRRWEQPVMDQNGTLLLRVTFTDGSTTQLLVP